MSEASKAPSAKIIFDKPAKKDAFSGQGHLRSAKAMADGIQQLSKLGGAIGLEGIWGSGKSSVIDISQTELAKDPGEYEYHAFSFDLWTHQTDEFRRSLLEEFIEFIAKSPFSSEFNIEEEKNIVRNRKKRVINESKRRYTILGVVVVLLLPYLPIVYGWLNPTAFAASTGAGNFPYMMLWLVAWSVALLPILMWLNYGAVPKRERDDARTLGQKLTLAASHFLTLSRSLRDETTTQWIRDEDPTTVEFHSVFRALLKKAQAANRRIVFVLDNIDRLPPDLVQSAWSEMRALFSANLRADDSPVVVVVPYDRDYVLKAFPESGQAREKVRSENDVFEKTFDRIIKVSPPVPSDWGGYLSDQLKNAFDTQLDDDKIETLFRLLKYKLQLEEVHPTPRRIVAFVNEIGALWTQWGAKLPVGSIALYVLHRDEIDRNERVLTKPDFIDKRYLHILNQEEWRTHLTALTFNVEPELANQVLLGQPIANAIVAHAADELVALSKLPGFTQVFVEELAAVLGEWNGDVMLLSKAAENVNSLTLTPVSADAIWRDFAAQLPRMTGTTLDRFIQLPGLFRIVERQSHSAAIIVANIIRSSFEATIDLSDADKAYQAGLAWVPPMRRLSAAVASAGATQDAAAYWQSMRLPKDGYFTVAVATACKRESGLPFDKLQRSVTDEQLGASLRGMIIADPEEFNEALSEVFDLVGSSLAQSMTDLATLLQSDMQEANRRAVFDSLTYTAVRGLGTGHVRSALSTVAKDGSLAAQIFAASEEGDDVTVARGLWLTIGMLATTGPIAIKTPNPSLAAIPEAVTWFNLLFVTGDLPEAISAGIADLVVKSHQFPNWVTLALNDTSSAGLFKDIIRKVVQIGGFYITAPDATVRNYDGLKLILGPELTRRLLAELGRSDKWVETSFAGEKSRGTPRALIEDLAASESDTSKKLLDLIDAHLAAISTDQWEIALQDAVGDDLRLLVTRQRSGGPKMPVATFLPAMASMAIATLEGRFDPATLGEMWPPVLASLPANSKSRLALAIFNRLQAANVTARGAEMFTSSYKEIAERLPLHQNADAALNQYLSFLVSSSAGTSRQYFSQKAREIKRVLSSAGEEALQAFEDVVDGIGTSDPTALEWEAELRSTLGLRPKASPKVEANEDKSE